MSARVVVAVAGLGIVLPACGHVDPGEDFQFSGVVYDQNFFYCKVEPMLFAQRCAPGDPAQDPQGGCHSGVTGFKLTEHEPVACSGNVPSGPVPQVARSNFDAASRMMSPDPDQAELLRRPTKQSAHPRQIFESTSAEAEVIRDWAEFTAR